MAENLAAADPVPGPHDQRLPFGALVLEFMAKIVVAAFLWLLWMLRKKGGPNLLMSG